MRRLLSLNGLNHDGANLNPDIHDDHQLHHRAATTTRSNDTGDKKHADIDLSIMTGSTAVDARGKTPLTYERTSKPANSRKNTSELVDQTTSHRVLRVRTHAWTSTTVRQQRPKNEIVLTHLTASVWSLARNQPQTGEFHVKGMCQRDSRN